ncbi:MAG: hypothetical protein LKJ86_05675 [Oscillibacter sp.]|jgi:CheY-like chemotaxis protein|nr:hypothetical protein [Oscillibacter sp.]
MTVILLCEDEVQRREAEALLKTLDVRCTSFSDRRAFLDHIRSRPDLMALLMEPGPHGTETAAEIREQNPNGKFLWFSDLDFSLLSFRLHADYFGLLPVTESKLRAALLNAQKQ